MDRIPHPFFQLTLSIRKECMIFFFCKTICISGLMRFCLFYTPAVSNYCGERVKSTLKKIEKLAKKEEDLASEFQINIVFSCKNSNEII